MNLSQQTDIPFTKNNTVYHLDLGVNDIVPFILTVGDKDRVSEVSAYFDKVSKKISKREFTIHIGILDDKEVMVICTGMGTDNIEIVLNELNALFVLRKSIDADFASFLTIIRLGTSGSIAENIPVGSIVLSEDALGWDILGSFYSVGTSKRKKLVWPDELYQKVTLKPYITFAHTTLLNNLSKEIILGQTLTCPGFYAPQGRKTYSDDFSEIQKHLLKVQLEGKTLTNLEMETAGIYLLSHHFGHRAASWQVILANRITNEFHRKPKEAITFLLDTFFKWFKPF